MHDARYHAHPYILSTIVLSDDNLKTTAMPSPSPITDPQIFSEWKYLRSTR